MALTIVPGLNSYVSEADADTYLEGSIRAATIWPTLSTSVRRQALSSARRLIDQLSFVGTPTGVLHVATALVAAGGTGYVVGDVLALGGSAQVKVLTAPGGVVATVEIVHAGYYLVFPTSPVAGTGGTGAGATFTLTSADQVLAWPRTGVSGVGETEIPTDLQAAQCELAFELTQDPSLETATDASKNIRRVAAGSAEVSFFRPTTGARFPTVVMQYLTAYLGSGPNAGVGLASGTDGESWFEDPNPFGLTRGHP